MYKVGYIDDEKEQYYNYKKKLSRNEIDLILFSEVEDKNRIIEQIYENNVEGLLIDYKLSNIYNFTGTTLINYINDNINDLPCFIMTGIDTDVISDKIVEKRNMFSKTVFDTQGDDKDKIELFNQFVNTLKESVEVFREKKNIKLHEYKELFERRKKEKLSIPDEERYIVLYKVLSSYGMVEKLPDGMLKTKFDEVLDNLIEKSNEIINKLE